MAGRQMARDRQTSTHSPLSVWSDEADACSRRLIHDNGISDIDTQFFELGRIKETVPIVTNATDEGGLTSKLGEGDDGVRYRSAADKLRFMLLITLKQRFLFFYFDKAHRPAFETE